MRIVTFLCLSCNCLTKISVFSLASRDCLDQIGAQIPTNDFRFTTFLLANSRGFSLVPTVCFFCDCSFCRSLYPLFTLTGYMKSFTSVANLIDCFGHSDIVFTSPKQLILGCYCDRFVVAKDLHLLRAIEALLV